MCLFRYIYSVFILGQPSSTTKFGTGTFLLREETSVGRRLRQQRQLLIVGVTSTRDIKKQDRNNKRKIIHILPVEPVCTIFGRHSTVFLLLYKEGKEERKPKGIKPRKEGSAGNSMPGRIRKMIKRQVHRKAGSYLLSKLRYSTFI